MILTIDQLMKKWNLKNEMRRNSLGCFYGSMYFDSFGGPPDAFMINQLPKPITYHN